MTITVGIPFHNPGTSLMTAVRSVFAQTHADWELILTDDGSTDGASETVAAIRDPRVRLLRDRTHRGLSTRLNEITAIATSPLVARMDADDIMHPERLARQVAEMEQKPEISICASRAIVIDETLTPYGIRGELVEHPTAWAVFSHGLFVHPTVVFRRAWAIDHPYSDLYRRGEDRHLWCTTYKSLRFSLLSAPLLFYREPTTLRLAAYLESSAAVRRVVRNVGPEYLTRSQRSLLLARSKAADTYYRIAHRCTLDRWAIHHRNTGLADDEAAAARATLARIQDTPIPGLPQLSG